MIKADFEVYEELFNLINDCITSKHDGFRFQVDLMDGYIETALFVLRDGIEARADEAEMNDAILYRLVDSLCMSANKRGELWSSFSMSYVQGGQAKVNFSYH